MTGDFVFSDGVYHHPSLTPAHREFEKSYNALRERENRNLSVTEVRGLPLIKSTHLDYRQWQMRAATASDLRRHLRKGQPKHILEVGCGNGFLSHLLASDGHRVTATDINLEELKIAAEAFGSGNPKWYYMDVMTAEPPGGPFDTVLLAASVQYFASPVNVIKRMRAMAKPGSEVHIVDTPFYKHSEIDGARERTKKHVSEMGQSGFTEFYFHHSMEVLSEFNPTIVKRRPQFLSRLIGRPRSPFPWIIIKL
jgi:2-polyprenyl-3-methyl-5-hydroxy-6-metoxy-1,4-benzoquinol methylase